MAKLPKITCEHSNYDLSLAESCLDVANEIRDKIAKFMDLLEAHPDDADSVGIQPDEIKKIREKILEKVGNYKFYTDRELRGLVDNMPLRTDIHCRFVITHEAVDVFGELLYRTTSEYWEP